MAKAKPRPRSCAVCAAPLKDARVSHEERRDTGFYLFHNVPVEACPNCGEIWISESTLREIDRLIEGGTPTRTVATPVFDLSLVEAG